MTATHTANLGQALATEIAWLGHSSEARIADLLAELGITAPAAEVIALALEAGLLREVPRLGGYTASRKTNARVFGQRFAEWMAA